MFPKATSRTSIKSVLYLVAVSLCVYCLVLTVIVGDFGFEGDDWWVFSWPFWNSFPGSLYAFARDCLRPVEGVYWISLFECFGFDRIVFHLGSLVLAASGCFLMGLCLAAAFPDRPALCVSAVLTAFLLPTIAPLTYVLATDNSRLCVLLFWASTLAFQKWALRNGSWLGLTIPVLLYLLSFLTYEAAGLLIFTVPLWVWPVIQRKNSVFNTRDLFLRLGVGIFSAFGMGVAFRFLFLSGGAVKQRGLLPSWDLLWSYPALIPFYLVAPFSEISCRPVACFIGAMTTLFVGIILFFAWKAQTNELKGRTAFFYPALLGLAVLVLGMLPYQLAGYGSVIPTMAETARIKWGMIPEGFTAWFNFNWSGRIYSSASYGIALLLAWFVTSIRAPFRVAAGVVIALYLGAAAAFHVELGNDWKEAGRIRNQLVAGLVEAVPSVESNTGFVFLDLECSYDKAAVFRGWNGLRELICMLYRDRRLGAWYLYPDFRVPPNRVFSQAQVSPEGFVSRAMGSRRTMPLENLIIMKRNGSELVHVNAIRAGDGSVPTGIAWNGTSELISHSDRIRGWSNVQDDGNSLKNRSDRGLAESLGIVRLVPRGRIPHLWEKGIPPKEKLDFMITDHRMP